LPNTNSNPNSILLLAVNIIQYQPGTVLLLLFV